MKSERKSVRASGLTRKANAAKAMAKKTAVTGCYPQKCKYRNGEEPSGILIFLSLAVRIAVLSVFFESSPAELWGGLFGSNKGSSRQIPEPF